MQPPRLKVQGTDVIDPTTNQPIIMTGYNWGQWGTMQEDDGQDNARQGANSVRIPLRWWGDWRDGVDSRDAGPDANSNPSHIDPAHLDQLTHMIDKAAENHLWVTLFVDSNNGQGAEDEVNGYDNFWTDPKMKQEFIEVWQFLVAKYRNHPYIAAYEILPEPRPKHLVNGVETEFTNQDVHDFYDSIIPKIREVDSVTPIVIGPNEAYNLHNLADANTDIDDNIIYTGDYFIFDDGNTLQRMQPIQSFLQHPGKPVWINQVGIRTGYSDPFTKAAEVLEGFQSLNVGWAWWTFREDTDSPDEHGTYYFPNGEWKVKPCWYTFIPTFYWAPNHVPANGVGSCTVSP